jgi:hypothetical protein
MTLATVIRPALEADLKAIDSLRKADGDSLGFLPIMKLQCIVNQKLDRGRWRWLYESLWVAEDNGELTGYVLAGFHRDGAKIEQICVRGDARRMERAMLLEDVVQQEARLRQKQRIRCRVAFDIEANFFWKAIGYIPIATVSSTWMNQRESKSQRPLVVYDKTICQPTLI